MARNRETKVTTKVRKEKEMLIVERVLPEYTSISKLVLDEECEFETLTGEAIKVRSFNLIFFYLNYISTLI